MVLRGFGPSKWILSNLHCDMLPFSTWSFGNLTKRETRRSCRDELATAKQDACLEPLTRRHYTPSISLGRGSLKVTRRPKSQALNTFRVDPKDPGVLESRSGSKL